MNNPNPYSPQAPPALPPGVDVKISYAARTGGALGCGGVLFVLAAVLFVVALLRGPDSNYTAVSCKDLSDEVSCSDHMVPGGVRIAWTVRIPGTYRLTLQSKPTRALELDTGAGKKLGLDTGKDGPDATVEAEVSMGEYAIHVTDPPSTPANANKSFTLFIAPPSLLGKAGTPFGILLATALIFLGIPLLFVEEKKYIPVRIDAGGVTMPSGARHLWSDFQGITIQTQFNRRSGTTTEVATCLNFARGRAVIRYRPITNKDEVMPLVRAFQQGRNPFA